MYEVDYQADIKIGFLIVLFVQNTFTSD